MSKTLKELLEEPFQDVRERAKEISRRLRKLDEDCFDQETFWQNEKAVNPEKAWICRCEGHLVALQRVRRILEGEDDG